MLMLYRAPFSTNVERVALALAFKGLEVESVVISYEDRSPVVEVSGQGLVPALVDGDEVIPDSIRILRYLEEKWPDPPLFPRETARRAELAVFLDWFNEVWKLDPNTIEEELERDHPDRDRVAPHAARMRASLDRFEAMLDGREHLFGDDFSAADCAAFPFLKYGKLRDPDDDELFHRILEDNLRLEEGSHPRLSAWIDRVNERPRA
jgi:glutathione S-transferase